MESGILTLAHLKQNFIRYKPYIITLLGLFIGFSVSSGLLLYSGKELVNAIVYLFFVVFLPALFSTISLVILLFKRQSSAITSIRSSFAFGMFFSLGAAIALIVTVTIKDIAFGWATTLNINVSDLTQFLNSLALWKGFCHSCTLSEQLISISHFTRLGHAVSNEQISRAKELGEWWRYLAMSILFYGLLFRLLLWIFASILPKKDGALFESSRGVDSFSGLHKSTIEPIKREQLKERSFRLLGYEVDNLEQLGLSSDENAKNIVVALPAWEPPILEFFDYLEELEKHNSGATISLLLLGIDAKEPNSQDVAIWLDKLESLKREYEVII